jgi:hypothetical protein
VLTYDQPMGQAPLLRRYRAHGEPARLGDPAAALTAALGTHDGAIAPGDRVAIGVGSRGIDQLPTIIAGVVRWVATQGGVPIIVPAMGSHGGATAEGQREVLAGYGVTSESVGAPIEATMDVVELPGCSALPVWVDAIAAVADRVILVNRIKPHTDFAGEFESGLVKMAAIGLGNRAQASAIHALGAPGLRDLIGPVGRHVIEALPVTLGVAVVENRRGELLHIEVVAGAEIVAREPELLALARKHTPRLPIDEVDLLLVERIGKEVSGTGMDTHVIGRRRVPGLAEPSSPKVGAIYAASLTAASHGNALGMGLADVVSAELAAAVDRAITNANVLTSGFLARGNLPFVAADAGEAVTALCRAAGLASVDGARVLVIRDTLDLETVLATEDLAPALAARGYVATGEPIALITDGRFPAVSVPASAWR